MSAAITRFGKDVKVKRGIHPAFQPLNSKLDFTYKKIWKLCLYGQSKKTGRLLESSRHVPSLKQAK
jgi:hypothetical protein